MKIQSAKPHFEDIDGILEKIRNVLDSGRLILGKYTFEFENEFSKYIGVKHAVAVSSATAGLEMVLRYWDVKDKEVIIPTNTFIACANATVYAGGKPIFCDINPETYCMSADDVLSKISPNTKVVMAVHLAGLPIPDIFEIKKICGEQNIYLLEDCSHAHGAMIDGKKVGSLGDAGVFSLYPTKVITTCAGGVITTNNNELHDFAKSCRHHGQGESLESIINFGNNWLMDEIRAILGIYQLKELENYIKERNILAKTYIDLIEGIQGINYFEPPYNIRHSYYRFLINLKTELNREDITNYMRKDGIEVGTLYATPLHLQPIYKALGQKCPNAEQALYHQIGLPMHVGLNEEDVMYIANSLHTALRSQKK